MAVLTKLCVLGPIVWTLAAQPDSSLFDYDRAKLPKLDCQDIAQRTDASVRGCGFAGPRGGQVNLVLVMPKTAKPPYAGVLFQHGGGQSMTNYLSEALILARAGVVSMLTDAPARGEGVVSEVNQTKLDESQRFQADVVVALRMALDHLLNQNGVDPSRIAFVGHSYGAVAGGVLAGVDQRFRAFVLLGGVVSEAEHIRNSRSPYWEEMRRRMTPDEFARTMNKIEATDPARFLPSASAPMLVQCARLDTPDNIAGCPKVHELAGGPKRLVWYDEDHHFTSWEAAKDRLSWLAHHLLVKDVQRRTRDFWQP
jgi:pimeloyl-ACP methyl ester carboxylesterase